eukprot:m.330845 g.330845  ORF g.330845 m.330845 type:complete len:698 (-) comp27722_c0_seq4:58-2151(-)
MWWLCGRKEVDGSVWPSEQSHLTHDVTHGQLPSAKNRQKCMKRRTLDGGDGDSLLETLGYTAPPPAALDESIHALVPAALPDDASLGIAAASPPGPRSPRVRTRTPPPPPPPMTTLPMNRTPGPPSPVHGPAPPVGVAAAAAAAPPWFEAAAGEGRAAAAAAAGPAVEDEDEVEQWPPAATDPIWQSWAEMMAVDRQIDRDNGHASDPIHDFLPWDWMSRQKKQKRASARQKRASARASASVTPGVSYHMQAHDTPEEQGRVDKVALGSYQPRCRGELQLARSDRLVDLHENGTWTWVRVFGTGNRGWVPTELCGDPGALDSEPWYFGHLGRGAAEHLLRSGHTGVKTFLIRTSTNPAFLDNPRIVLSTVEGPMNTMRHFVLGYSNSDIFKYDGVSFSCLRSLAYVSRNSMGDACQKSAPFLRSLRPPPFFFSSKSTDPCVPNTAAGWLHLRRVVPRTGEQLQLHRPPTSVRCCRFRRKALEHVATPTAVLMVLGANALQEHQEFAYSLEWRHGHPVYRSATGVTIWREGPLWCLGQGDGHGHGSVEYQLSADATADPHVPPDADWRCGEANPHYHPTGMLPPPGARFRTVLHPQFFTVLQDNRRWSASTHRLLHPGTRLFVLTVMLCAQRIRRAVAGDDAECECAPTVDSGYLLVGPDDSDDDSIDLSYPRGVLPSLPLEMWLSVLEVHLQGDMLA